jgi:hypothetical protein
MHPTIRCLKIHFLEKHALMREPSPQVQNEVDNSKEGMTKDTGGPEAHEATVVDRPPFLASRERLVMRWPVLCDILAELVDGALVHHAIATLEPSDAFVVTLFGTLETAL